VSPVLALRESQPAEFNIVRLFDKAALKSFWEGMTDAIELGCEMRSGVLLFNRVDSIRAIKISHDYFT
jgi:hypothetical protein